SEEMSLTITLPDGSQQSVPDGARPLDVAKSVSPRLAADAIVARVNGELFDLTRPLESDANVEILTTKNPEALQVYSHSTAHLFSEYTLGPNFIDFCRGPHVPSTEKLKAFKLLSIAGAYWKGNEKNPQLQRIYGTAFFTKKELEDYLNRLEEAKKRDHRRIGKDLELFAVNELVGAGLPLWLPKGATVRRVLEEYILEKERASGYQHVYTPDLAKIELYQRSGHWE